MLKAEILGQLMLMQNVLINLPDEKSIFSFVCRGFSDLPGVKHVYYSETITENNDNSILPFRLEKNNNFYGELVLKISDYDKEIITAKGNRKWVKTMGEAVRNDKGEIYKVQGAFQDISEQKQRELEIRQQLEELKRWHKITLGRESRIIEIKREVNDLCKRLGEPPRYPSQETTV